MTYLVLARRWAPWAGLPSHPHDLNHDGGRQCRPWGLGHARVLITLGHANVELPEMRIELLTPRYKRVGLGRSGFINSSSHEVKRHRLLR